MTITGKEMNHGEKSPQVYVKPEGIYIVSKGFRHLPPATRQDNDSYRRTYSENSVPCHHPQKRDSASLILIMPQKEIKKSTLLDRKRVEHARQKDLQSSTPSYHS